jgi:hypothetical protein
MVQYLHFRILNFPLIKCHSFFYTRNSVPPRLAAFEAVSKNPEMLKSAMETFKNIPDEVRIDDPNCKHCKGKHPKAQSCAFLRIYENKHRNIYKSGFYNILDGVVYNVYVCMYIYICNATKP